MQNVYPFYTTWRFSLLIPFIVLLLAGCGAAAPNSADDDHDDDHGHEHEQEHEHDHEHGAEAEVLTLPELLSAELNGQPLRVVATTSIIGDIVAQVGGDAVALTTLMGAGQDPHAYEPAARDLTAVADAHVVFINGWNLEEGLVDDLENIAGDVPVVPISANIEPLTINDEEHADPHVWLSISGVEQWVANVSEVLSDLDPEHAADYAGRAAMFSAELQALAADAAAQLGDIPEENRYLVTNHDGLGYFAREYGFTVLGTVIPGSSTVAEPSASDLAGLVQTMEAQGVCTIFAETTVSDALAQTVANELDGCARVLVQRLYTGALGEAGSGADSYIGMFRANINAIVEGLQ